MVAIVGCKLQSSFQMTNYQYIGMQWWRSDKNIHANLIEQFNGFMPHASGYDIRYPQFGKPTGQQARFMRWCRNLFFPGDVIGLNGVQRKKFTMTT